MAFRLLSKRSLSTTARLHKETFGITKSGQSVDLFKLRNSRGMEIEVINYGAHLRSCIVPDKNNNLVDVTIGLDNISDYEERNDYFGCIAGRYANRIAGGKFKLNNKEYSIPLNDGVNTLHGGFNGFSKQVWNVIDANENGIKLNYISPDGEEGYPSECNITVEYKLYDDDNTFSISYYATTDNSTIINVTNHAYWNLNGKFSEINSICNGSHELFIKSSFITPISSTLIPTGELLHIDQTPFDFRNIYDIGARINDPLSKQIEYGKGYDHNYVINNDGYNTGDLIPDIAQLKSNENGIKLSIDTDQPGIQFYSGNFLDGKKKNKNGDIVQNRSACCLETHHFPDSPNHSSFPSTVLKKDKPFSSKTIHKFSVDK